MMNTRTKQTQRELRIGKNARRTKSSLGNQPLVTHEERILERRFRTSEINFEQLEEETKKLKEKE